MTLRKFLPLLLLLSPAAAAQAAPPALSSADQAAAFRAAGFSRVGTRWRSDCGDPGTASYSPGAIETVRDLNGDGRSEAGVEGSTYCYGNTGTGFAIVSKQPGGRWRRITGETGIATFLPQKGVGGWPDIEIGGPGFCFPVRRWNGKAYVPHRYQYHGRACRPPR